MRKSVAFKIAVSPLVLGLTMVGCSTTGDMMVMPVAQTASNQQASHHFDLAQQAAEKGDFAQAIGHAERAVEQAPRDLGYRMLLGDVYLKNGRFVSAETAFGDVLTLDPANSRARFNLALAQIALGKAHLALVQLDRLTETESAGDLGLAYALAGQPDRAVTMLEGAARLPEADGRVRQNLALAYALSGDWQRARITASQDLSPAVLPARMEEWAAFAQPTASYDQVATLLGVIPITGDAGQPVRLALAPEAPEPVAYAQADVPAVEAAAVEYAAVEPAEATQPVAEEAAEEIRYAEAAQTLVIPQAVIMSDGATPVAKPIAAFAEREETAPAQSRAGIGRYVVQLGAYSSAASIERAWSMAESRYNLDAYAPVSATVNLTKGTFHRLSVAGFNSQSEAIRKCRSIKGKGGACFVRTVSGDAPIRLASRDSRNG